MPMPVLNWPMVPVGGAASGIGQGINQGVSGFLDERHKVIAEALAKQQEQRLQKGEERAQQLFPLQKQMQELNLQKLQEEAPYFSRKAKAELDYKIALANRQRTLADPNNMANIKNGPAKAALDLETIRITHGQNSDVYKNAKRDYDSRIRARENMGIGVGGQQLNQLAFNIKADMPNLTDEQAHQAANAYIEGKNDLPDGTKLPKPSGSVRTLLDEIEVKRRGMKAVNQAMRAVTLDRIMAQGDSLIGAAVQYSGLPGAGQLGLDKVRSAFGEDTEGYKKYSLFTREIVPTMMGEMLLTLGGNQTDQQKKMMRDLANPIIWDRSPRLALMSYMYLKSLFKDVITPTVAMSPSEIKSYIKDHQDNKFEKNILSQLEKLESTKSIPEASDEEIANEKLSYE